MLGSHLLIGGLGLFLAAGAFAEAATGKLPDCSTEDRDIDILSRQEPYYPHSAQMFCVTGKVRVAFTIDRQGVPKNIRILESQPEGIFDRSTVDTIEQWRFIPACRQGEPAEREAIQTIEFRLPGEAEQECAQVVGELDSETADLIAEVGARYALLAEYWRTGDSWSQLQAAIEAPFGDFDGDLGRVADFHRQALERIPQALQGNEIEERLSETVIALMPHSLEDDPELERARDQFEQTRAALNRQVERGRRTHAALSEAYRQLQRDTGLDGETLALLVEPFLGDPETPFEESTLAEVESLDRLESILEFLESNRGQWRIDDNEIRFDRSEDLNTSQALWEEFLAHRHEIESRALNSMRSLQDYSD